MVIPVFSDLVYSNKDTFGPTKDKGFNIPPPEFHPGGLENFSLHVGR